MDEESMVLRQAVEHEQTSVEHSKRVEAYNPWTSPPAPPDWDQVPDRFNVYHDLREQERRSWVDICPDLVSFWLRGVVAAERGEEVERMQQFLERLETQKDDWGQPIADNPWGMTVNPWERQWGIPNDWDVHSRNHKRPAPRWDTHPESWSMRSDGIGHRAAKPGGDALSSIDEDIMHADMSSFVEKYARRLHADAQRTTKMRMFSEVSLFRLCF
jgi:hypothetical protein